MYEKILVPLDGSSVGEAALHDVERLAVRMLPDTPVEVTLLQVISNLTYNLITEDEDAQLPYSATDLQKIDQMARKYLEKVAARLRSHGINVKTMVSEGHEAEEIIKAAGQTGADLIAMSTHGRSGFRRWALGSVTDKVLHESTVPVLTVRARP